MGCKQRMTSQCAELRHPEAPLLHEFAAEFVLKVDAIMQGESQNTQPRGFGALLCMYLLQAWVITTG